MSYRPPRRRRTTAAAAAAVATFTAVVIAACAIFSCSAVAQRGLIAPEAGTGRTTQTLATASRHMVSAANVHAAEAGREILRQGGTAADAAIAAQLVLGLVEPQSSGLGGGGFALYHDAETDTLTTYDGRETAPHAARPDRFLRDGRRMAFDTAVHSGASVGVPGLARLLETLHRRHGRRPWKDLFAPAIRLAENGFAVSPRLHLLLRWMGAASFEPAARHYFFHPDGAPRGIGEMLRNPEYAATLRQLADEGADAMHSGRLAEAIVAAVRAAPNAAGDMTLADLADYAVKERPAVCFPYRGFRVCGMGPPSSGGLAVAQTLTMLERFDLGRAGAGDGFGDMPLSALHLIGEAQKLAYADRDRYVADPDFVPLPGGLTDPRYLAERARLIDAVRPMPPPAAGRPPGLDQRSFGHDLSEERVGTTHFSVIDAHGNTISMTTTIESVFGARLFAAGFLLNNQLTDFSLAPADREDRPIANRVEGGKRPRSSMAPTIVYDSEGKVFAALGSPGGARIPLYVMKALVALIDWKLDAQAAVSLPNFGSRGRGLEMEAGWSVLPAALRLAALGHRITVDLMTSGTHIVLRRGGRLEGAADPRREGAALGD